MSTLREQAKDHVLDYFDAWDKNIQSLINAVNRAEEAVKEIKAIKDEPSFRKMLVSSLIDVALSVVVPGGFQLSRGWRAFSNAEPIKASNIQHLIGLTSSAREAYAKNAELAEKKREEEEAKGGGAGEDAALSADVVTRMVAKLEKKKAEKSRERDAARSAILSQMPENSAEWLHKIQVDYPEPALLGDVFSDVVYAFEWALLKHYASDQVKFRYRRWYQHGTPLGADQPNAPPATLKGLSKAACEKVFARYKRKLTLAKDTPLIGSVLNPIVSYQDMVRYWGCEVLPEEKMKWPTSGRNAI